MQKLHWSLWLIFPIDACFVPYRNLYIVLSGPLRRVIVITLCTFGQYLGQLIIGSWDKMQAGWIMWPFSPLCRWECYCVAESVEKKKQSLVALSVKLFLTLDKMKTRSGNFNYGSLWFFIFTWLSSLQVAVSLILLDLWFVLTFYSCFADTSFFLKSEMLIRTNLDFHNGKLLPSKFNLFFLTCFYFMQ